jgi:non-ribosomal peptide synthase protein (TIGR01720 family)
LPGETLKSVKEQLRRIPNHGLSFGLLRDLAAVPELRALPVPQVSFNYLGQFGRGAASSEPGLFEAAPESPGPTHSGRARRTHWLDINGSLAEGQLQFAWTFSAQLHRRETVERVAGDFIAALCALAEHSRSPQAGGHTPSDFKHVRLDQRKLNKVLAQVGQKGRVKR